MPDNPFIPGVKSFHMSEAPLSRRNRELMILNTIAETLNKTADLDQILRTSLSKLAELFDLHTAWIWLLQDDTASSYLAAAQNLPPALKTRPERMEGSCHCLDTYMSGDMEGAANINVIACSRLKFLDGTQGLQYHTSIPLYANEKKLGILNVASTGWQELSKEDLRLLHTAGDMLSMAIERARLYNQSRTLGALEERNRLAREIHDTLAQGLTAVAMNLETVDALIETGKPTEAYIGYLQAAIQLTRSSLEEARRSVMDLRAAPLEGRTLPEALNALADGYRKTWNLHTVVTTVGQNQPLPPRVEVGLYRIAQEALSNAHKHADASAVSLKLKLQPERVQMVVQDNGSGFELDHIPEDRFGLIGLNERVKLLGGKLEIQTSDGDGTRISVMVPFNIKP
jgi:two-component system NarL family sensor kinase